MSLTKREMAFGIVRPPKGDYIVAQYKLGVFYYKGQGVVKNEETAEYWMNKSAVL